MQYMLVKINPDNRFTSADRSKMYSGPVTKAAEYAKLASKSGEGFHECMNFMEQPDGLLHLYFSEPSRPATQKSANDEFTIFLCTYAPSTKIIGVHAGVRFLGTTLESKIPAPKGIEKYFYVATCSPTMSALFEESLSLEISAGRYAPKMLRWGNGRRYIDKKHAQNILCDATKDLWSKTTIVDPWKHHEENVKRIYEKLFVETDIVDPASADETATYAGHMTAEEGTIRYGWHAKAERSSSLIAEFKRDPRNMKCCVCGFSFEKKYGELGENYIEAHHNVPLSQLREGRTTDLRELSPVCANCHRMLHRRGEVLTVEELKRRLATR